MAVQNVPYAVRRPPGLWLIAHHLVEMIAVPHCHETLMRPPYSLIVIAMERAIYVGPEIKFL
jgi:hypothetical protein